MIEFFG